MFRRHRVPSRSPRQSRHHARRLVRRPQGLGIGAAWNDEESTGLGLDFPPTAERFERLEETLQICLQMCSDRNEPFHGTHYQLGRTLNSPASLTRPRPPIMVGGNGERKTLRLVAKYADACNIFAGPDAAHKLDVLRGHCETARPGVADVLRWC